MNVPFPPVILGDVLLFSVRMHMLLIASQFSLGAASTTCYFMLIFYKGQWLQVLSYLVTGISLPDQVDAKTSRSD